MRIHTVYAFVKKVLPDRLARFLRSLFTGLLTPIYFSYSSGHFISSLRSKAVSKNGQALPWYTYPAIEFLASKDLTDCTILEFGAGQSTLWWASHSQRVVSFESDHSWYEHIKSFAPSNVQIFLVSDDLADIEQHIKGQLFDIIIIDGLDRFEASRRAKNFMKPSSGIILDNSEGYWGPEGTYPIMNFFRDHRFSRIDFYGHAPGVFPPHCTSLFYKNHCFLLEGNENPQSSVRSP
jgi:hypothetical protein